MVIISYTQSIDIGPSELLHKQQWQVTPSCKVAKCSITITKGVVEGSSNREAALLEHLRSTFIVRQKYLVTLFVDSNPIAIPPLLTISACY